MENKYADNHAGFRFDERQGRVRGGAAMNDRLSGLWKLVPVLLMLEVLATFLAQVCKE